LDVPFNRGSAAADELPAMARRLAAVRASAPAIQTRERRAAADDRQCRR